MVRWFDRFLRVSTDVDIIGMVWYNALSSDTNTEGIKNFRCWSLSVRKQLHCSNGAEIRVVHTVLYYSGGYWWNNSEVRAADAFLGGDCWRWEGLTRKDETVWRIMVNIFFTNFQTWLTYRLLIQLLCGSFMPENRFKHDDVVHPIHLICKKNCSSGFQVVFPSINVGCSCYQLFFSAALLTVGWAVNKNDASWTISESNLHYHKCGAPPAPVRLILSAFVDPQRVILVS